MTKAGYEIEYEIKTSMADFRCDAKKLPKTATSGFVDKPDGDKLNMMADIASQDGVSLEIQAGMGRIAARIQELEKQAELLRSEAAEASKGGLA